MTHMVDDLYKKTVAFSPSIDLDQMTITLKLRESTFEKIKEALDESHILGTDTIRDIFAAQYQQEAPAMTVQKLL